MIKLKRFKLFEKISQAELNDILNNHIILNTVSKINIEISRVLIMFGAIPKKETILKSFINIHNYHDYFKQFDLFSDYFDINDTFYINGIYQSETLLSITVHNHNNKIVIELLKRGAKINIKTKNNQNLIDFLDNTDIKIINNEIPGFKLKIEQLKRTRKFNL